MKKDTIKFPLNTETVKKTQIPCILISHKKIFTVRISIWNLMPSKKCWCLSTEFCLVVFAVVCPLKLLINLLFREHRGMIQTKNCIILFFVISIVIYSLYQTKNISEFIIRKKLL